MDVKEIKDLPRNIVSQLETFFVNFNELEENNHAIEGLNAHQVFQINKTKIIWMQ